MADARPTLTDLENPTEFIGRHVGPSSAETVDMLSAVGLTSLEELVDRCVPESIRDRQGLDLPRSRTEQDVLSQIRLISDQNHVVRSLIGMGYYDTHTPPVILRNVLENPGWYTAYTPYQAEISQGRMEALLNYQTMVSDLTGREIANASMLDEGTAAAEAMTLCRAVQKRNQGQRFFVDENTHPQTIEVVETRAEPLGIEVVVAPLSEFEKTDGCFALLMSYPDTFGGLRDLREFVKTAHDAGSLVVVATDLLALTVLESPGHFDADVVVGNSQRFGVPFGFGGPHAAFFATREDYRRRMPGRIIGVSRDSSGRPAMRLALQTREQHIRREKATWNICTAQVLLAVMAGAYAVYHGPDGLTRIAHRVHRMTGIVRHALEKAGVTVENEHYFDTLTVQAPKGADATLERALAAGFNLRRIDSNRVGLSFDETTLREELEDIVTAVVGRPTTVDVEALSESVEMGIPNSLRRQSPFLEHPVFHDHRSETQMLRYLHQLQAKDLSLTTSMIPLGSCTMKLNATAEMIPVTWEGLGKMHPFAPTSQTAGYQELANQLEEQLRIITGFAGVSLQPNAGSQGEYAGLLVIRRYHQSRGDSHRDVCLIPSSAHGTNPASAVLAGMKVVVVKCDDHGNIDVADLRAKAHTHRDNLAALMVTYPSTHGVFETAIREICDAIHECGGQVYMDGANTNALIGLAKPGEFGPDVMHFNLHKTFCIPHGGGGPGVGPIGVGEHLVPHLPGHILDASMRGEARVGAVSAAPYGSASILPISWSYIAMMGRDGLEKATQVAILNANYIAKRLEGHYPVLYTGEGGWVAHECIIDTRPLKEWGIEVDDVAKRLMDFGFHAPTMSWPVAGTLMIEPTESESKDELDRFCDALIQIRNEVRQVESGEFDREDNPLKRAPHTVADIAGEWDRPYSRDLAVFPLDWVRAHKFWPSVNRVDNAYGDRNLVCMCPPMEAYAEA